MDVNFYQNCTQISDSSFTFIHKHKIIFISDKLNTFKVLDISKIFFLLHLNYPFMAIRSRREWLGVGVLCQTDRTYQAAPT